LTHLPALVVLPPGSSLQDTSSDNNNQPCL